MTESLSNVAAEKPRANSSGNSSRRDKITERDLAERLGRIPGAYARPSVNLLVLVC